MQKGLSIWGTTWSATCPTNLENQNFAHQSHVVYQKEDISLKIKLQITSVLPLTVYEKTIKKVAQRVCLSNLCVFESLVVSDRQIEFIFWFSTTTDLARVLGCFKGAVSNSIKRKQGLSKKDVFWIDGHLLKTLEG